MASSTIYQAGPLFTEADQSWCKALSVRFSGAGTRYSGLMINDAQIYNAGAYVSAFFLILVD